LTSEEIFNLPASIVLESMLPRSRQQLADAGTHAVRKAGDSTACRTDRLGMTGDDCESFAEILDQLDPRGGSGKFFTSSLEKRRRRRRGRSLFAGSHLPSGPIE
jgi:hypothetical protein